MKNFSTPEPGLVKSVLLPRKLPDNLTESQIKEFLSFQLSYCPDLIARDSWTYSSIATLH